jgi:hypothetical protein
MLTIEKVKREIPRFCGFKDFRILGKDEDVIRVFKDLIRAYNNLQNIQCVNEKKEQMLYDVINEFTKIVKKENV